MDNITPSSSSPFSKASVVVKPFEDNRKPLLTECSWVEVSKIEKEGKTFYYNCDNYYKLDSVAGEITRKVTDHLNQAHVFDKVIFSDVATMDADYLLTGSISKFDGLKELKIASIALQSFGLLGALANLALESSFEATTTFSNLQLIRTTDKAVIWSGDITGHIEGDDTVDPYGWSSYRKANLSLKEANTKLIAELMKIKMNGEQAH